MTEHPIATYELDEEQLLAATITEIAEARLHLNDAEQCLLRNGKGLCVDDALDASLRILRAMGCARVASARVDADELPVFIEQSMLQRCVAACDVALAHVKLLENVIGDETLPQILGHAKKAVDAARGETHKALAILLAVKA